MIVCGVQSLQVLRKILEKNLQCFVVLSLDALLKLSEEHWHTLLEKSTVLRISNGNENVLESLQCILADGLVRFVGHVGCNDSEKLASFLNKWRESLTHIGGDALK